MTDWRDIPGFEGRYRLSSAGEVLSLGRKVLRRDRWGGTYEARIPEKVLKVIRQGDGQRVVNLYGEDGMVKVAVKGLVKRVFPEARP